ncbi:MAG: CPBP family intramembrane metalloprotease [Methanothrix sp.]|nr:CPBP family intramembrane metalloprotease [Methanothrix sp.]
MKLEDLSRSGLDLVLPLSMIFLGEMLIFLGNMKGAMMVHALTLTLLVLSSAYIENRIYPALMLLPLFRLLNVAMPVFFQLTIYSYSLVYAPMFIPIIFILKDAIFNRSETGLTAKGFWFYLPLAVAVGFALGFGEYNVLHTDVLIPDMSPKNILILSLIMILFVGTVEEFIFRSVLQTVMEERLGAIPGLLVTSITFGVMHSGYHIPLEILFVSFAGVVFGLLFWMTRSLPVIAIAHGVTNISLFLVSPLHSDVLVYLIGVPATMFLLYCAIFKKLPKKIEPLKGER